MPPRPNTSIIMTQQKAVVDYLFHHFKKGQALLAGSRPGFGHALKLSHQTMDPQRVIATTTTSKGGHHEDKKNKKLWSYRYQLSSPDVPKYSVGLLTALMDELSTDACFREGLPSPPGVSLQMQTEVVNKDKAFQYFQNPATHPELDILNSVTKLGKSIAHTRTDYRCPTTQALIAFSSHVKYMPTGSRVMDAVFRSSLLYEWYLWWMLDTTKIPIYPEKRLWDDVLLSNLQYHDPTIDDPPSNTTAKDDTTVTTTTTTETLPLASFTVTTEHTNPFGALHGGCHAMIMEQVGTNYAQRHFQQQQQQQQSSPAGTTTLLLEAMQVEYLSGGQPGLVDVYCETIGGGGGGGGVAIDKGSDNGNNAVVPIHVRVSIKQQTTGRLCSEGKLRFSVVGS